MAGKVASLWPVLLVITQLLFGITAVASSQATPTSAANSSEASRLQRLEEIENKYKSIWALNDTTYYSLLFVYGSFMLFGFTCNALICLTVILRPRILSPRNIFIVNLAASDLLLCVFTMPFSFMEISMKVWKMGVLPCKLVASLQATSIFVSTISITAIALDRYKVIVYPTHQEQANATRGAALLLLGVWAGALVLSVPLFAFRTVTDLTVPSSHSLAANGSLQIEYSSIQFCVEQWPIDHGRGLYSAVSMVFQYVLPITIVSLVYAKISHKLHKRLIRRQRSTQLECQQKRQLNLIRRTHRMLISVSLIFGLSWLPLNLLNLIGDFTKLFSESDQQMTYRQVFAVCHLMGCSCACSNPILYAFLNENFRKEFKQVYEDYLASLWRLLAKCFCCGACGSSQGDLWSPSKSGSASASATASARKGSHRIPTTPAGTVGAAEPSDSSGTDSLKQPANVEAKKSLESDASRGTLSRLLRRLCACMASASDSLDSSCDSNLNARKCALKGVVGHPREFMRLTSIRLGRRGTASAAKLAAAGGIASKETEGDTACSCECHQAGSIATTAPNPSAGKRVLLRFTRAPATSASARDGDVIDESPKQVIVNVRHCNLCRPSAFCEPNYHRHNNCDNTNKAKIKNNCNFPDGPGLPLDGPPSPNGALPGAPACFLSVAVAPERRNKRSDRKRTTGRLEESPSRERCTSIVSIEQQTAMTTSDIDTTNCNSNTQRDNQDNYNEIIDTHKSEINNTQDQADLTQPTCGTHLTCSSEPKIYHRHHAHRSHHRQPAQAHLDAATDKQRPCPACGFQVDANLTGDNHSSQPVVANCELSSASNSSVCSSFSSSMSSGSSSCLSGHSTASMFVCTCQTLAPSAPALALAPASVSPTSQQKLVSATTTPIRHQ